MPASLKTSSQQRLLVIKHGALGDSVQGFGAFASLRHGHPTAHISLLTTPAFAELGGMMPWFDQVLVDRRAPVINIADSFYMRSLLRQPWDIIIDLQCSRRTARYFQFFVRPNVRWVGTVKGCSDPCPDFTEVNNYQRMMLAAGLAGGVAYAGVDMRWLLQSAQPVDAQQLPKLYSVLVPGCSLAKPQKRWPAEKFAKLATRLQAQNIAVILVGTAADSAVVDLVQSQVLASINLCGKTSIAELARLMAAADSVVGNDTGPVFLAAATGAPTIMLMGPDTDPAMSAPTGARCDWIKGTPITKLAVDDVLDMLRGLKGNDTR